MADNEQAAAAKKDEKPKAAVDPKAKEVEEKLDVADLPYEEDERPFQLVAARLAAGFQRAFERDPTGFVAEAVVAVANFDHVQDAAREKAREMLKKEAETRAGKKRAQAEQDRAAKAAANSKA